MNTPDKERKNMVGETITIVLDPINDFVTHRPAIVVAIGKVKDQYLLGIDAVIRQGIPTHGVTINLAKQFGLLTKVEFRMCSAGSAYFASIGDDINRAKVNFTLPQIEGKHYNGIGTFADGTLLTVTPAIAALLTDFGGSVAQRDDVVAKLANYRLVEDSTDIAIDSRKGDTSAIHPFMMAAIKNLEELVDPIVNTMEEDFPDLFSLYWNGRKINHFPHGTTIAEGYMYDNLGHPIYKGSVFFPDQGKTLITHLDGSYYYPLFPHGVAAPVGSFPGFHPNTAAPYEILKGHTVKHNFTMVPII